LVSVTAWFQFQILPTRGRFSGQNFGCGRERRRGWWGIGENGFVEREVAELGFELEREERGWCRGEREVSGEDERGVGRGAQQAQARFEGEGEGLGGGGRVRDSEGRA